MKLRHYILLIGFIGFISFPLLNGLSGILPDISSNENRRIREFPDIDTLAAEKLSAYSETYLNDHISIRNRMIKLYNQLNIFVFRSSPVSIKAIVGREGWYFMSGEEIKTYSGTELFNNDELEIYKKELLYRKKFIEDHGAKMLFAIVPNKSNVYPEFMPSHIIKANDKGYGKQLMDYLKQNGLPVIDLYTPLTEAKKINETYFHTDNHWNDFGAFIAVNTILTEFKKIDLNVETLSLNDYPLNKVKDEPGNIAKMFSIENNISEYNIVPTPSNGFKTKEQKLAKYKVTKDFVYPQEFEFTRKTGNDSLPNVLIIRDSFGKKPFPYIAEQCNNCTMIFDAWQYGLNKEIIEGEKPDIVLYLVIESQIKNILKHLSH